MAWPHWFRRNPKASAVRLRGTSAPRLAFLLAPPMRACRAARFFSCYRLYRALTGEMGGLLADEAFMQSLPLPPDTVIYAGTAGPRASWLPVGNAANDGILARLRTKPAQLNAKCGDCSQNQLCGGCRIRASVDGDIWGDDPACFWTDAAKEAKKC